MIENTIKKLDACCYQAADGFMHHLENELSGIIRRDGELITAEGKEQKAYWVKNIWQEPFTAEFDSIGEAAKILRSIQRNWSPFMNRLQRRTTLISEKLPHIPNKPKEFPFEIPNAPMGAFTLLDEHTLMASAKCSSPWPNGDFSFVENQIDPPSRAYRKIWEALLYAGKMPGVGTKCLDAGSCPGGWTWALACLGADVISVDRAEIDEKLMQRENIHFIKHNAFTMKPEDIGKVDWFCSDIICYPPALYEWVKQWLDTDMATNFICTIKMQGRDWDRETTKLFQDIKGSKIIHLNHNKHELTWILIRE